MPILKVQIWLPLIHHALSGAIFVTLSGSFLFKKFQLWCFGGFIVVLGFLFHIFSLSFLKFWVYEITFPNVKRKNDTRLPYRNILNLIRMLMVETHFICKVDTFTCFFTLTSSIVLGDWVNVLVFLCVSNTFILQDQLFFFF